MPTIFKNKLPTCEIVHEFVKKTDQFWGKKFTDLKEKIQEFKILWSFLIKKS